MLVLLFVNGNCVISVIACNASGESDVKIDCEGITSQISVSCSFNEGPLHPCENILFYLLHHKGSIAYRYSASCTEH